MATLTLERIADIQESTLPALDRGKFTDLSTDQRRFPAFSQLMKDHDETEADAGFQFRVNVMLTGNGVAEAHGLNQPIAPAFNDAMTHGQVPIRYVRSHFTWNLVEDQVNANTAAKIYDLLNMRRAGAETRAAELIEGYSWSKPTDDTDVISPYGIQNYITRSATEGFNGGNPSGFTSGVILNSTTYPRWGNYTYQYTNVTKDDLVTALRKAAELTHFQSPVLNVKEIRDQTIRRGWYMPYSVKGSLVKLAQNQNMNLGADVAALDGETIFLGAPLNVVPTLESDIQNPIYGIDWTTMSFRFLQGWMGKEDKPREVPNIPDAAYTLKRWAYNMVCTDRRRQIVANIA